MSQVTSTGRVSEDFFTASYPIYKEVVNKFFDLLAEDQWNNYSYQPAVAAEMLMNEDFVKRASLEEIKTMLTYCWRSERFSEGHLDAMIEGGHIRRLLERINEIKSG